MNDILLVVPTLEHENAALSFVEEVMRMDDDGIHGSSGLHEAETYSYWLENVTRNAAGESLPHLSPADTYFAIRPADNAIVGIINIRHQLDSDFMRLYGGHIGYTVRPRERRKGYAKQMLRLALQRCKARQIHRVLLTCDPVNIASSRTIEACGGILENEIPYPGTDELVRRYWIDL